MALRTVAPTAIPKTKPQIEQLGQLTSDADNTLDCTKDDPIDYMGNSSGSYGVAEAERSGGLSSEEDEFCICLNSVIHGT